MKPEKIYEGTGEGEDGGGAMKLNSLIEAKAYAALVARWAKQDSSWAGVAVRADEAVRSMERAEARARLAD